MSYDTAVALRKFLESGHKNAKEIPEHLLGFILESSAEPSSLSEGKTSPHHQPKRSRRCQGQPASDNGFPLEWCNIRTFRAAIRNFDFEVGYKTRISADSRSISPLPQSTSPSSPDPLTSSENKSLRTPRSAPFDPPTTVLPVRSSRHFRSYSLEPLKQPIFTFGIQTVSTATQTINSGYRDAKTSTGYTKPYKLRNSEILYISTTPEAPVRNITASSIIEVVSIAPVPVQKSLSQPTISLSEDIVIASIPPSLPRRRRYRHHSTSTPTTKAQQILPWPTYIVEPVDPIMASTVTGVNGGANADKVVEKTPDATCLTPAQIQSIAAIVAETIRQERKHDDNYQSPRSSRQHNHHSHSRHCSRGHKHRDRNRQRDEDQTADTRDHDPDDGNNSSSSSDSSHQHYKNHHRRRSYSRDTSDYDNRTFKPNEIGLLWPDLPESYGYGEIVDADGKTIYRSAFAFANRLRVASQTRSIRKMAKNLELCLRGTAQRWWNYELSSTTRRGLIYTDTIEDWCEALEKRFQLPPSQARERLDRTRYTITDIRNRVPPSTYVSTVLSLAKQCGETSEYDVVLRAWRNMNIELRSTIPEPKRGTTIERFIRELQQWETNWYDKYDNAPRYNAPQVVTPVQAYYGQRIGGRISQTDAIYGPRQYQRTHPPKPSFTPSPSAASPQQMTNSFHAPFPSADNSTQFQIDNSQGNSRGALRGRGTLPTRGAIQNRDGYNTYPGRYQQAYQRQDQNQSSSQPSAQQNRWSNHQQGLWNNRGCYQDNSQFRSQNRGQWQRAYHAENDNDTNSHDINEIDENNANTYYGDGQGEEHAFFNAEEAPLLIDGSGVDSAYYAGDQYQPDQEESFPANHGQAEVMPVEYDIKAHHGDVALPCIKSTAPPAPRTDPGEHFRTWKYATCKVRLSPEPKAPTASVCLDSGCTLTIIDRDFLQKHLPNIPIRKCRPIPIKGIGDTFMSTEFVLMTLWFLARLNGNQVLAELHVEAHLTTGLKANMLIGADTLGRHRFTLDFGLRKATIRACHNATLDFVVTPKPNHQEHPRPIFAERDITVPPKSKVAIPIRNRGHIPNDRDYLFEPKQHEALCLFAHSVRGDFSHIYAVNNTCRPICVERRLRLGELSEIDEAETYYVTSNNAAELAVTRPSYCETPIAFKPSEDDNGKTTTLDSGIVIYGDPERVAALRALVEKYEDVWTNEDVVNVPEEDWLRIELKPGAEERLKRYARRYPLCNADRQEVNKVFDKLHQQGRMDWVTKPTPTGAAVFVVKKWVPKTSENGKVEMIRKDRVVIDLRPLNKEVIPDVYPLPSQADIIATVAGCEVLSIADGIAMFYQWPVHPDSWRYTGVISHRGHEYFKVAVMGFKNSIAHVQRQVEAKFRALWAFLRAYVDDFIVFSKKFAQHLVHLQRFFEHCRQYRITLNPKKTFLGFPSIRLLGQNVTSLGLTATEDKLEAILALKFPTTLSQLDTYIGMTNWLQQYIPYYAAKIRPLQQRKTFLLKGAPLKGRKRKNFAARTELHDPTPTELEAFNNLQQHFKDPLFLCHHNPDRTLFIDQDSSKERGHGMMAFHMRFDDPLYIGPMPPNWQKTPPQPHQIQPILFLSRMLSSAETKYWPTELEMSGLVWAVRKLRHLIQASKHTIVFTDHSANVRIASSISLSSSDSDKMNLKLVRAAMYLQQYPSLEIVYKPGKLHIIPDALSRLPSFAKEPIEDSLDALHADPTILGVEVSESFKRAVIEGYDTDPNCRTVRETIEANMISPAPARLAFELQDGLIYTKESKLLCPRSTMKDVLAVAHDQAGHPGLNTTIANLGGLTFPRTRHWVKKYIDHCQPCWTSRTRRHLPYGSLQPILPPKQLFHTISLDIILGLPDTGKYNAVMNCICRFSKRITSIPGRDNWSGAQWAFALIERLAIADWGIPEVIISDRDPKFLGELWTTIFKFFKVQLLYSTAYHSQTDGGTEILNQKLEIFIRYCIGSMETVTSWPELLPRFQAIHNATPHDSTDATPHQIMYGQELRTPLSLALDMNNIPKANDEHRFILRETAHEALKLAGIYMKSQYDKHHLPMVFNKGDKVMLRLHKGYTNKWTLNRKLNKQYSGPYKILEKVGRLAYRLNLPQESRIYPVISVAHLEKLPARNNPDPFERTHKKPGPVYVDADEYEIERIIDVKGSGRAKRYLVRWKGYGEEDDFWLKPADLENAKEAIADFEETRRKQQAS